MKLMVLTCAVFAGGEPEARRKLWIFLKSTEKFGVPAADLHLYGMGRTFPGYRAMKLDFQLEYLKSVSGYTHVLYTDAWDAFFTGPLSEIIAKYEAMGSPPMLDAAFYQMANVSDARGLYPGCFDESTHYRYPHVGGYIAEVPFIIDAFERLMLSPIESGDDCFNWYAGWIEGWFRPKLDSNCDIFQVSTDCIAVKDGRCYNLKTKTFPCILHISGGYSDPQTGKDDRVEPWAKELGIV
jgi:hypothetical protein